jgi:ABC-type lipoprotein export system ATPase subunit
LTSYERGRVRNLSLERVGVDLAGRNVLDEIDLAVRAGSPVAVMGPSGSGKTVLCLVMAGALSPTRGRVLVDDRPFPEGECTVGLVLQTHGLVSGLTAEENVSLPLQARRIEHSEIAIRTTEALAAVGLADQAGRTVDDLSGGERQRVGIARAIAGDPDLLICDEPTSELDPRNRELVIELLMNHASTSRIVAVASDDREVLDEFEHVIELESGHIKSTPAPCSRRPDLD